MRMNRKMAVALSGSLAFLAACSDSPMAPVARVQTSGINLALLEQPNVNQGEFKVCSANASASFSVTFADALGNRLSPPLASTGSPTTLNVAAGTCAIIWSKTIPTTTPADVISSVTIVQTGQAAGYEFQMVEVLDAGNLGSTGDNATKTAVLKSNAFHGATATFTQRLIPPPPGNQGCTPGYWKQDQHLDSWQGYTPVQTLESVFDVPDAYGLDNVTLLNALSLKGGSTTAEAAQILMRAAVAGLLNAASSDVDYVVTTAQLIASVNAALASNNRDTILALAATIDAANNGVGGCPLN